MPFRANVVVWFRLIMDRPLVFDIGIGNGVDSTYYLMRGFQVIAVDASIEACSHLENLVIGTEHQSSITIINKAIAPIGFDHVTFCFNEEFAHLSSIDEKWALRDGGSISIRRVESLSVGVLLEDFGVPVYVKCDIEGAEVHLLKSLEKVETLPRFLSLEDCRFGMDYVQLLSDMGYQKFQLVDQSLIPGSFDDFGNEFGDGSSGRPSFDLPLEEWYSLDQFRELYFSRVRRPDGDRVAPSSHWFDIHAQLHG